MRIIRVPGPRRPEVGSGHWSLRLLGVLLALALSVIGSLSCTPAPTPASSPAPKSAPSDTKPAEVPPAPKDVPIPIGTITGGTVVPTLLPYPKPGEPGYVATPQPVPSQPEVSGNYPPPGASGTGSTAPKP